MSFFASVPSLPHPHPCKQARCNLPVTPRNPTPFPVQTGEDQFNRLLVGIVSKALAALQLAGRDGALPKAAAANPASGGSLATLISSHLEGTPAAEDEDEPAWARDFSLSGPSMCVRGF